ncbi:MAG: TonB-dependent receptor [Gammaproteobacteria bacterium]|nr:TonB-dependent receptor [Gammaproteobacteria bacterium]
MRRSTSHFTMQPLARAIQVALALCATSLPPLAHAGTAVHVGRVQAKARKKARQLLKATNTRLTPKQILKSTQSERTLGHREIAAVGPAAGAAQVLAQAPGIAVRGYGGISGSARYEIAVRGVKIGWSSVNGDIERNGLTVLFDGVPMNNLTSHNGGWDSNEIPILALISGVNVIYGPGNPATRWFDSVGGTINFVPVQPTSKAGGQIGLTYGSNQTEGANLILNTGTHKGWSTVLAYGFSRNNTFRTGAFAAPSRSSAFFGKTVKTFENGSFSVGGYVDDTKEFRPNFIPVSPIYAGAGGTAVTVDGTPNTPLYSQTTTGFYSSLPEDVWFKQLTVRDRLIYAKLKLDLDRNLTLHDMFWYRHGHRIHWRVDNYNYGGTPPGTVNSEWYYPTSDTYGNRLAVDWALPYNLIEAGGSWITQTYNTPYTGYNATFGTSPSNPVQYNNDTIDNTYLTGFVQDSISPIKALTVTPGIAAVDFQTAFYNNGLTYTPPGAVNQSIAPNDNKVFTRLEPSIGARWMVSPHWSIYGNWATTYQNPTDNAFGAYSGSNAINLSSLKPVKSVDYEIGTRFLIRRAALLRHFALNLNFYHDALSNETLATYISTGGNFANTEFASASATYDGVNVSVQDSPTWHWHVYANAAFARAHFDSYVPSGSSTNYGGYPVSYSPRLTATAGVNYRVVAGSVLVSPGLMDQFTGTQYLFDNVTNAPTNNVEMPSYNVMNAQVAVRAAAQVAGLSSVTVTVGVTNLLNKHYNPIEYITSGGYFGGNSAGAILADPGAPRQYFLNLSAKF